MVSNNLLERDAKSTRGYKYKLKKSRCYTSLRQHFLSFRVVDSWNSLPLEVVEVPSLVPTGSPSCGGDVKVYVLDINRQSLPTPFTLFSCLFLSLWFFQLYFIP